MSETRNATEAKTEARQRPRRRWRWARRIGLGLVVVVLLAMTGHWYWGYRNASLLAEELDRLRRAGEPVTVADLVGPPVAEELNTVPLLRAAADAVDTSSQDWQDLFEGEGPVLKLPMTDREAAAVRRVVSAHSNSLAAVSAAVNKPQVDWDIRWKSPLVLDQLESPKLRPHRNLLNLLRLAALDAHAAGDDARAVQHVSQMLFVSRAIDHIPSVIGHLVSLGGTRLACDTAVEISTDMRIAPESGLSAAEPGGKSLSGRIDAGPASRRQVQALIGEMLDERASFQGLRRGLRGERVIQRDAVTHFLSGVRRRNQKTWPLAGYVLKPMALGDARLMVRHTTELIAAADQGDWPAYDRVVPDEPREVLDRPALHLMARILSPGLKRVARNHYEVCADRRTAASALAVHLYRADHGGEFPERLQDLVPDYLPSVPSDPLAGGPNLIGYVTIAGDPERPRVYHAGSNGIDDRGREPVPGASRREYERLSDEVRHLKRHPRPKPEPEPDLEPEEQAEADGTDVGE